MHISVRTITATRRPARHTCGEHQRRSAVARAAGRYHVPYPGGVRGYHDARAVAMTLHDSCLLDRHWRVGTFQDAV